MQEDEIKQLVKEFGQSNDLLSHIWIMKILKEFATWLDSRKP